MELSWLLWHFEFLLYVMSITSTKEVMFLPVFVCLSVSPQDNPKCYGRIFLKFGGYVGQGINYQWFNFRRDPAGILDSGSLWNFRYHSVKGGMREPLAKRRWWRHLANSCALAEVPAGYDCFLVYTHALNTVGIIFQTTTSWTIRSVTSKWAFFFRYHHISAM